MPCILEWIKNYPGNNLTNFMYWIPVIITRGFPNTLCHVQQNSYKVGSSYYFSPTLLVFSTFVEE